MNTSVVLNVHRGAWISRRRIGVLLIMIALILGPLTVVLASGVDAQDVPSETAFAVVDGQEFMVVAGDTIAQGELTSDGGQDSCVMPKTAIMVSGDAGTPSVTVSTTITADCREVVTAIDTFSGEGAVVPSSDATGHWDITGGDQNQADGMNGTDALLATRYRSGGWHEHKDVVGLVLTESYADMRYSDDGGSVYGGYSPYTYCHNALDGWYGNWSSWNWGPNGPGSVWIWKMCNFSFIGGSFTHTLEVDVYSWPGNAYNVYCSHWGSFAPGGYFSCSGNHWAV